MDQVVLCLQRSSGATRRDRTGDLLITKFRIEGYAIDSVFVVFTPDDHRKFG